MIKSKYGTIELEGNSDDIYADLTSVVKAIKSSGCLSIKETFEACLNGILSDKEITKTLRGSIKKVLRLGSMSIEERVADVMLMIAEEKKDADRSCS